MKASSSTEIVLRISDNICWVDRDIALAWRHIYKVGMSIQTAKRAIRVAQRFIDISSRACAYTDGICQVGLVDILMRRAESRIKVLFATYSSARFVRISGVSLPK